MIFGVRRSGNHALTQWLTNAVDNDQSDLLPFGPSPPLSHCFKSPTGSVVHLNELNELGFRETLQLFRQVRHISSKRKLLILSFEDVRPSDYHNFRRLPGSEIWIRRNPLEIISSRYHNINQKSQKGIGWSRQSCDEYFFGTLHELLTQEPKQGQVWDYNKWLESKQWKRDFLDTLSLGEDITPHHSSVGGGSSFHGTSGKIESNMLQRLEKVEPNDKWRSFLNHSLKTHPKIFDAPSTQTALQFLSSELEP